MEQAEKTFAEHVSQRLEALQTNPFAFERAHGLPADAIRSILRGGKKSGTTLNKAHEICEALGLELYIGPKRDTGPIEQMILDGTDFAQVPVHQAELAAGGGIENHTEGLVGHLAFRRSWLKDIGVSASSAVLARATGESMAPTIHDNDMLLIDRSKSATPTTLRGPKDTRPAPIFAILDDGAARVKRLELAPGGTLALFSDNPSFAPEFRPVASVEIIGKVMWWGHTNRE